MWTKFQPAIIKYVFFPYCIYLSCLSQLAAGVSGRFIRESLIRQQINFCDAGDAENCTQTKNDETGNWENEDGLPLIFDQGEYYNLKIQVYTSSILAISLLVCFSSTEIYSMIVDGFEYFSDPWNCVDAISITFNTIFLTLSTGCILNEGYFFDMSLVRSFGGFACFFMWIKVFYWMRLFSSLAYYVKLIMQTLTDSFPFMIMVAIIVFAFANYFYVINNNLVFGDEVDDDGNTPTYYGEYYGSSIGDVIVSIYLMGALGDFDSSLYTNGVDKYAAMSMFLLALFIIAVVFMNMLIAIMGDTFGQVLEGATESGIREQVVLISDHAWLLDLKKIFKGKKYIIIVTPSVGEEGSSDPIISTVKETESVLHKKMTRIQNSVQSRIDNVDVNTRFLLALQQSSIQTVIRKIKKFEALYTENSMVSKEEVDMGPDQIVAARALKQKKIAIMESLNAQTSAQKLTIESVQEIAMQWMDLADKDGNGTLDLKEFTEFFSKVEGMTVNNDEISQIFNDFDTTGDGQLSVEEFARAIYQNILADQEEYSHSGEDEAHNGL